MRRVSDTIYDGECANAFLRELLLASGCCKAAIDKVKLEFARCGNPIVHMIPSNRPCLWGRVEDIRLALPTSSHLSWRERHRTRNGSSCQWIALSNYVRKNVCRSCCLVAAHVCRAVTPKDHRTGAPQNSSNPLDLFKPFSFLGS